MSTTTQSKQSQSRQSGKQALNKPRRIATLPGVLIAAGGLGLSGEIGILGAAILISCWLFVPAVYLVLIGGILAGAISVEGTSAVVIVVGLAGILAGVVIRTDYWIETLSLSMFFGGVLVGMVLLVVWIQSLLRSAVVLVLTIGLLGYLFHRLSLVAVVLPKQNSTQQMGDAK